MSGADWRAYVVAREVAAIAGRENFSLASYGDGEWYAILDGDVPQENANDEAPWEERQTLLTKTLIHPAHGMRYCTWPGTGSGRELYERAAAWAKENAPDVHWLPFRPLGWAVAEGVAAPIFRALQERRIVLVGPEYLRACVTLRPAEHIVTHPTRALQEWRETAAEALFLLREDDVVLFAAGTASPVLVWHFARRLGTEVTFYDAGSSLDPLAGVWSRNLYRDPDWRRNVLPRNLT